MKNTVMWRGRRYLGWVIALAISVLPVGFWLPLRPINVPFSTLSTTLTSLGQLTGLVGIAMFAVAMMLSARVKIAGVLFNGLNKAYQAHHTLGLTALLLLLAHPLMLAMVYVPVSPRLAATFLLPSNDWPKNLGIFALMALMALILITLFARFRYQLLKFLHSFLGVAFILGSLHTLLIPSDVGRDWTLRAYLMVLIVLGALAYAYRTIFGRITVKQYDYVVTAVQPAMGKLVEVVMAPQTESLPYLPGQFIFISFRHGGISSEKHPFSIASSPHDGELRVLIKSLGDWTSRIPQLKLHATAKIEGAYGSFVYFKTFSRSHRRQIWIGGGSGIAPFLGMARHLRLARSAGAERGNPNESEGYQIDLWYATKTREELAFLDEMTMVEKSVPGFRVIPYCSDERGRLTAAEIIAGSGAVAEREFFICGPPPMMASLKRQLRELKVPAYLIHTEEFQLL